MTARPRIWTRIQTIRKEAFIKHRVDDDDEKERRRLMKHTHVMSCVSDNLGGRFQSILLSNNWDMWRVWAVGDGGGISELDEGDRLRLIADWTSFGKVRVLARGENGLPRVFEQRFSSISVKESELQVSQGWKKRWKREQVRCRFSLAVGVKIE